MSTVATTFSPKFTFDQMCCPFIDYFRKTSLVVSLAFYHSFVAVAFWILCRSNREAQHSFVKLFADLGLYESVNILSGRALNNVLRELTGEGVDTQDNAMGNSKRLPHMAGIWCVYSALHYPITRECWRRADDIYVSVRNKCNLGCVNQSWTPIARGIVVVAKWKKEETGGSR